MSAFPLMMLTGCATFGGAGRVSLPTMPADLRACADKIIASPGKRGTDLSRGEVAKLIGDLKRSESQKAECLRRLIAWHDDQAAVLGR